MNFVFALLPFYVLFIIYRFSGRDSFLFSLPFHETLSGRECRDHLNGAKCSGLTFLKANLSLLLSRIISSHFKQTLNVPKKCFGG